MWKVKNSDIFSPRRVFGKYYVKRFRELLCNIQDDSLSKSEKRTLLTLVELNGSKPPLPVTSKQIAEHAHIHPKTANAAAINLERKGFLFILHMRNRMPNTFFLYWKDIYNRAKERPVYKKETNTIVTKILKTVAKSGQSSKEIDKPVTDLLTSIKTYYHPDRANMQPAIAKRELALILEQTVSGLETSTEKEQAIDKKRTQIIDFINQIKLTETWKRDDGKYLLGLGNFLATRGWETAENKTNKTIEDEVSNLLESGL